MLPCTSATLTGSPRVTQLSCISPWAAPTRATGNSSQAGLRLCQVSQSAEVHSSSASVMPCTPRMGAKPLRGPSIWV
ncbi:hypothetical protein D3C81_2045820 [compost metagenome]